MNFDAYKRDLVQFYADMAKLPGWREQAWYSINDLARQFPQFYADLPQLVTVEVHRERK